MASESSLNFQHWVLWLEGARVARRTISRRIAARSVGFPGPRQISELAAA
jgi:hypothetical protein